MSITVPFFRPEITEEAIAEVADSIRSGWLTTGPKVKQFESAIAERTGAKHVIALNSCTAALHLALDAIGLKRGDMVLVPDLTFAATAEVVRYFDAVPVFVDCDNTLCTDPFALETAVQTILAERPVAGSKPPYGRIKAVIPMHYGGYPCQMDEINNIAERYELEIIEDAAHTFPAYFRTNERADWTHTGRFGRVGCFSFYANKCITTGEGGAAVTDDDDVAERIRLMSLHGMSRDAWKRFSASGTWYYEIVAPGYKYNFTDIAAAIGLHQVKEADNYREKREAIALRYSEAFTALDALEPPPYDPVNRIHSWHLYPLRLNLERLTIDRNRFIDELKARGVLCSVHYLPLHLNPYYRENFGLHEGMFPEAEKNWKRLISLPLFPAMREDEIEKVIEEVVAVSSEFAL